VPLDPARLSVSISGVAVLSPGYVSSFSEDAARAALERDEVTLAVDLGAGTASARAWTCDLTEGYVAINASYRT
jgi:glutamate N-acetyltransferase/amino-acid N-acetyltransferase